MLDLAVEIQDGRSRAARPPIYNDSGSGRVARHLPFAAAQSAPGSASRALGAPVFGRGEGVGCGRGWDGEAASVRGEQIVNGVAPEVCGFWPSREGLG